MEYLVALSARVGRTCSCVFLLCRKCCAAVRPLLLTALLGEAQYCAAVRPLLSTAPLDEAQYCAAVRPLLLTAPLDEAQYRCLAGRIVELLRPPLFIHKIIWDELLFCKLY